MPGTISSVAETLHDSRAVYLREDTKLEPLVDGWYAWPHLLSPAQQAMNLAFRYLPMIRSFVANPDVHAIAAKDPLMFGGPFVDLPKGTVEVVKRWLSTVRSDRAEAIQFAHSLRQFDADLEASASGGSMNALRRQLPDVLDGRVDLVYDLHHRPSIRCLEEAFAFDDMGHRSSQSLFLHQLLDRERPFFLSTPRVGWVNSSRLDCAFESDRAQALTAARTSPIDLREFSCAVGATVEDLLPFFTNERPACGAHYVGNGMRIRHFGHACLLFESRQTSILVDPSATFDRGDGQFSFGDLPEKIDLLILSHGHQDHFSPELLIQLRNRVEKAVVPPSNRGALADPSLARMLAKMGYRNVQTIDPLDSISLADGRIVALPFTGEHCELDIHAKQCFTIELAGHKACILIDTDAVDPRLYRRIAPLLADVEAVFIGMECYGAPLSWLYGPLLSRAPSKQDDESRRLSGADCERAWGLIEVMQPRLAFVYALGQEPWMRHLMGPSFDENSIQLVESRAFIARCRDTGIRAEILNGGHETIL